MKWVRRNALIGLRTRRARKRCCSGSRQGIRRPMVWCMRWEHRGDCFAVARNDIQLKSIRKMKGSNMEAFHEFVSEYKRQLEQGAIQKAYRGLMEYVMALRTHFKNKYPEHVVSGSIYYGYMDMTYFSFNPKSLQDRGLKIAIVFVHEAFRFEVWLAGYNKQVQAEYWKLFKESGWGKYRIVPTTKGADAILEHILVDNPDFSDLEALTKQIETGTFEFIEQVESFLSAH